MIKDIKLTLGGEEREFSFGILFIGEVLESLDIDYNLLLEKVVKNPFKYAPILMFESLKNTYVRINKEVDFTKNDIVKWLEDEELMGVDVMMPFIYAFLGSNENKTPVETIEEEGVKKK